LLYKNQQLTVTWQYHCHCLIRVLTMWQHIFATTHAVYCQLTNMRVLNIGSH